MSNEKNNIFDRFLKNEMSWISGKGPSSEIVFSSRIRLARNLFDYPFPPRAKVQDILNVRKRVEEVYSQVSALGQVTFLRMEEIEDLDQQFLLERHLISHEHIGQDKGKALIVSFDEHISIMVNEEDHLRIQLISSGFNLDQAWQMIDRVDDELQSLLGFAFSPSFGYLTSCPTNLGTGLRASCMLHLPALVLTKKINKVLELLSKISFTTRGFFGEGTQALGDFFQISNQISLGVSEKELIANLSGVVNQVKDHELNARDLLMDKHQLSLKDRVWRSWGILKHSHLISTKEALSHLSMLSLGVDLGIMSEIERTRINRLFLLIQPAHLQKIENKNLNDKTRDYIRAGILREELRGGKDV